MTIKSIVINLVCCFVIAPVLSALILWACWALIPEPLPPPSGHSDTTQTEIIRPAPQTTVSGRTVYMAHCARCHGIDGDGRGTEKLDRPARSFLAGGFSFGNTPEAIRRVILHGIAGTPMPGYAGTLGGRDIDALVRHVRELAQVEEVDPEDTELVIGDHPRIVRGMIPGRTEESSPIPRGLVIGGTDGLTVTYALDAVRFQDARQGAFVRRTDWEGRGGTTLSLLGRVIHRGDDQPMFWEQDAPVDVNFAGTSIQNGRGRIHLQLPRAMLIEHASTRNWRSIPGYVRTFEIEGDARGYAMRIPGAEALRPLGQVAGWQWWRSGKDLIGTLGMSDESPLVGLPASGTFSVLVLPDVDHESAVSVGLGGSEALP